MHINNKSIFLFPFLLLIFNHIPSISSQCIEPPLFGKTHNKACPPVSESQKKPLNKITNSLVNDDDNSNSMIKIMFTCDEKSTPETCKKADIAFKNAATIVENTFDLKVPIAVNASFVKLCGTFIKCAVGQPEPLGAAAPSRLLPIKDNTDGETRLFPQALVKQLQLSEHPEFSPVDIVAGFNSNSNAFWFRGDPPIGKDQVDFEIILVHEFLHGLGFITSWDDYFNANASSLTPTPSFIFTNPEETDGIKEGPITFTGFQEYILDRHLVLTKDNSSLTPIAKKINGFAPLNTKFDDQKAFLDAFTKSPVYKETEIMFKNSITRGSVAIRLVDGENVLIETGLVPFKPGSTFSHVDFDAFGNTTDFLMRFKAPRQVILDDLSPINGDPEYTNPIGPKIISIFKSLGYPMKENSSTFKIISNQNQDSLTKPSQNSNKTKLTTEQQQQQQQTNNAFTITTNTLLLFLSSFLISNLLL
ncbi:unnamed protein product [Rhizophagus irregularis]|nr:unnamed protein product [Rhizophagus irregularis]CAB5297397.1 unnamed protein product [Rhizophagus irregularis]